VCGACLKQCSHLRPLCRAVAAGAGAFALVAKAKSPAPAATALQRGAAWRGVARGLERALREVACRWGWDLAMAIPVVAWPLNAPQPRCGLHGRGQDQ